VATQSSACFQAPVERGKYAWRCDPSSWSRPLTCERQLCYIPAPPYCPDDEEAGMFYKLNMSSGGDGSMRVWTEGADGEQVDMKLDDVEDHEPTVGLFGLTNEAG